MFLAHLTRRDRPQGPIGGHTSDHCFLRRWCPAPSPESPVETRKQGCTLPLTFTFLFLLLSSQWDATAGLVDVGINTEQQWCNYSKHLRQWIKDRNRLKTISWMCALKSNDNIRVITWQASRAARSIFLLPDWNLKLNYMINFVIISLLGPVERLKKRKKRKWKLAWRVLLSVCLGFYEVAVDQSGETFECTLLTQIWW